MKPQAGGSLDLPRIILPACLFISGASALGFEVVWAAYLTDLVGSTALAHTVVLSTFMGGLAGGAWLFGNWADRTKRPLVLYGVLELGVALTCLLFPFVFFLAGAVYVKIATPMADQTTALVIMRAALAVVTISIPSILMGGTLPAATRFYVRSISEVGSGVARLYFINALGAVLGCLLAGFALMPMIGLDGTLVAAASLNVIAGGTALVLVVLIKKGKVSIESFLPGGEDAARSMVEGEVLEPAMGSTAPEPVVSEDDEDDEDEQSPFPRWVAGVALASIAVAGAASMTYEIVWIRILTLVMGGSTYAFTTMLAAFILGIAIGSALVSWRKTRLSRSGLGGFGWLQVAVAAITVFSVPLYNRLPFFYHRMARLLAPEAENYPAFLGAGFLVCLAVMILPTILLGMTFPIAARLATRSIKSLGGGVGQTYACDTAGTVVGVVVAGHLLLPLAGVHGSLITAAAANLAAGLFCVVAAWRTAPSPTSVWTGRWRAVALGLTLFVLPGWMIAGPRLERMSFAVGVFRVLRLPFGSYDELAIWSRSDKHVLFDRDGANGTVTVIDYPENRAMNVNGKTDASDGVDLETQYLAAHLPVMLHSGPKSALVVGLGAGATTAGLLAYPELRVVTAELSKDIVEAARLFEHVNRGALDDPRLHMVLDDVQAWLELSGEEFDIIVSVPSNPWVAGNASLFTVEFFDRVKAHLLPGGVFLQWFHDYEMTEEAVRTILRTVSGSFPNAHLFQAGNIRDYLLVCSMEPLDPDPTRINRLIAENEIVRGDLRYARIRTHLGIYARHLLDTQGVREVGGEGRLHRRGRPLLEYQAPKGLFLRDEMHLFQDVDLRRSPSLRSRVLLERRLGRQEELEEEEWAEIYDAVGSPFLKLRTAIARAWADTGSLEGHRRLASVLLSRQRFGEAVLVLAAMETEGELEPRDTLRKSIAEARVVLDEGYLVEPQLVESLFASMLEAAEAWNEMEGFAMVGAQARKARQHRIALEAFEAATRLAPSDRAWPRVGYLLQIAEARQLLGDPEGARQSVDAALALEPQSYRAQIMKTRLRR